MKYIKKFENFKPIKINNEKPFKIKKNLDKSINHVQGRIKSLRKRLADNNHKVRNGSDMNRDKNEKIQKLKDLQIKQLKQAQYLKDNPPIQENVDVDTKNNEVNTLDLVDVFESEDFSPEYIERCLGFNEKEAKFKEVYNYGVGYESYTDKGFTLYIKSKVLEDLVDIDNGVLNYYLQFTSSYNNYDYDVQNDELDYIDNYLSEDVQKNIIELSKIYNYDIKLDEMDDSSLSIAHEEIHKFFDYLGLKDKLDSIKIEISYSNERAIKKVANKELDSLPFNIDTCHSGDFDIEIEFKYSEIVEYMKENNIEANTIEGFLEKVSELCDFSYELDYCDEKYQHISFDNVSKEIEGIIEKYLESPEEIFLKIIECDNLEFFKENFELADFTDEYQIWIKNNRTYLDLFDIAKFYDNKIAQWFTTKECKEKLKEKLIETDYVSLIERIENYDAKKNADIYNL